MTPQEAAELRAALNQHVAIDAPATERCPIHYGFPLNGQFTDEQRCGKPITHAGACGPDAATVHIYLSTACHHSQHAQCRKECEFCPAMCGCACHGADYGSEVVPEPVNAQGSQACDHFWTFPCLDCRCDGFVERTASLREVNNAR